jgi:hypothetical protein
MLVKRTLASDQIIERCFGIDCAGWESHFWDVGGLICPWAICLWMRRRLHED